MLEIRDQVVSNENKSINKAINAGAITRGEQFCVVGTKVEGIDIPQKIRIDGCDEQ